GDPLWTDGVWQETTVVDLRIHGGGDSPMPRTPMWHMGAYSTQVRLRMLDDAHAQAILPAPLPLRQGDRVILRDPGDRRLWGGVVLDPVATRVQGLGARTQRVEFLSERGTTPDYHSEVARFGAIDSTRLRALGIVPPTDSAWHMDPEWLTRRRQEIYDLIASHDRANPANPGMPPAQVVASLDLPVPTGVVVSELLDPRLRVVDGKITSRSVQLSARVERALGRWAEGYRDAPFQAPTVEELRSWGLSEKDLAAAARLKRVFLPAAGVVLSPRTPRLALEVLRGLPQPFTTSQARQALGTSRRVAIPLLEFFDRARITRRLPDNRREIISGS
ncbi:MAG TPA: SelB C-terminal domain-containing protein, partial [Beutenbergiaceae bacterium]|nr:SelB C-terminal domain-containing protein [Beutenbergiaceae bacterium]